MLEQGGTGKLILDNPNNDFTGGITISAGSVQADAEGAFGTGLIYTKVASTVAILNAEDAVFPNNFQRASNHGPILTFQKNATVNGNITATGACSINSTGISAAEGVTGVVNGSVTGCSGKEFYVTGAGTVVFNGKVNHQGNFWCSTTSGAKLYLTNSGNSFAGFRMRGTQVVCGAENVLNNATIYFNDGNYTSSIDLNGFNQRVKLAMNTEKYHNLGSNGETFTSATPATLTVLGAAGVTNDVRFRFNGAVSLELDADPTYTLKFTGARVSAMTGGISVKSGSFVTTGEKFTNISGISVAEGGKFTTTATGVLPEGSMTLDLATGAEFALPTSQFLTIVALTVDDELKPFGTYAAGNCPPIVSGTVVVPSRGTVDAGWTGGLGVDDAISRTGNWSAASEFDFRLDMVNGSFAVGGTQASIDVDAVFAGLTLDSVGGFSFVGEKTMSIGDGGITVAAVPETEDSRLYTFAAPTAFTTDQSWSIAGSNTLAFSSIHSPFSVLVSKTGAGNLGFSGMNVLDGRFAATGGDTVLAGHITTSAGVDETPFSTSASDRHGLFFNVHSSGTVRLEGVEIDKPFAVEVPQNGFSKFTVAAGTTNIIRGQFYTRNQSGQGVYLAAGSVLDCRGGISQNWSHTFSGVGTLIIRDKPYVDSESKGFDLEGSKGGKGALTVVFETTGNKANLTISSTGGGYGGTADFRVSEAFASGYNLSTSCRDQGATYLKLNATTQTFDKVTLAKPNTYFTQVSGNGGALGVRGSGASVIAADIVGNVSILKSGKGTLTMNMQNGSVFNSTGDILVSDGTLTFGENATWLNGTNIVVTGGTLALPTTKVFNRKFAAMALDGDGVVSIPDGAHCRVRSLKVGDTEIEPGSYTYANAPDALKPHLAQTSGCLDVCGGGIVLIVR